MFSWKKVALFCLVCSNNIAFSGVMGPLCSPINNTIPCESTAWEFGAQALYLQPSLSSANISQSLDASNHYVNYDPQYTWGFRVQGAYYFSTGNDLNLNWSSVEKTTHRSYPTGSVQYTDPFTSSVLNTTGTSIQPSWNAVNLELSQHVNFGEMKNLRFHGGVEYARLENDMTRAGEATAGTTTFTLNSDKITTYNGFGPRLGVDAMYLWHNGLGIYAKTAGALLIGTQRLNDSTISSGFSGSRSAATTSVVPEAEAKIGATYNHLTAYGNVTIDAGWMWINYFNALLDDHIISTNLRDIYAYHFALQGPFVGLSWQGNMI